MRVIARNCLDSLTAPSETCVLLLPYRYWLPEAFSEDDTRFLTAVSSEVDNLPVGKIAEHWHPDFLGQKIEQLRAYDDVIRADVTVLCLALIARLTERKQVEGQEV